VADLTSQLIVRLIDGVTGPATAAGRALRNLVTGSTGRLDRALASNKAALDGARTAMFDAAAGAYALYGALSRPIKAASEWQGVLLDIAQKANMSDEAMKNLGESIKALSKELGTSATELAKGVDSLIGRGLDSARALEIIPIITKTAIAYRSTVDDVSKASFAVVDNLKVPANELTKSLDIMASAGKAGAFELKDMAIEFPALTAAAANLGMTGSDAVARLAAALQIARKGAGTSSEAATNAANVMQKVISPETTKKFKALGVDIRAELKRVQKEGGDVFEMLALNVLKATKGDTSKIGDIFQDAQVQKFLIPFIQNLAEYRRIRDEAKGANGVIEEDFSRRVDTAQQAMERFNASMERLSIAVGTVLLPALTAVMDKIMPFADALAKLATENPQIAASIAIVGAALVGLSVALAVARYGFLILQRGALLAIRGIIVGLGPVGWAIAAIGLAATWIYNNWKGLTEMVKAFADAVTSRFPSLGPIFQTIGDWVQKLVGWFGDMLGPVKMTADEWRSLGASMGQAIADFLAKVTELPGKIAAFFAALPGQMVEIGGQIIQGLWDGMVGKFNAMMAEIASWPGRISGALGGAISAPSIRNSGAAPAGPGRPNPVGDLQRKSMGGPSKAGQAYLVGEQGPEIFRPNVNGRIIPNGATGGGVNINVSAPITIAANDSAEVIAGAVRHMRREIEQALRGIQGDTGLALV
jgi:TP901 family phage tail tape measure protein